MTRDDDSARTQHRKACIEAMKKAYLGYDPPKPSDKFFDSFDAAFTAAFDSLHGRATVFDPGVLRTMILSITKASNVPDEIALAMWERMSRAADLTNPPETKP